MKAVLQRFREPSTLAGLAAMAMLFGVPVGASEAVVQILGGVAALGAIFLPESKGQ